MPDAYYRISANQSEADETFCQHPRLIMNLQKVAPMRRDNIPRFKDIRATHRFPIKTEYRPCILMSNDLIKHTTNTNNFITGYNGDIQAQMYLKTYISAGTIDITDTAGAAFFATAGATAAWSFCRNFVPRLLKQTDFMVQGDTITDFSGDVLYLYSQWFVRADRRAALLRLWRETLVEFEYNGTKNPTITGGAGTATAVETSPITWAADPTNFSVRVQHIALQAPRYSRPAFYLFIPLDALSLARSLEQSFPLSPLYALERKVEFEYNDIRDTINVYIDGATGGTAPLDGWAQPGFGSNAIPWTATPSITKTELFVNYILVHRDLQRILSMNGYGYVIRQFAYESVNVDTNTNRELSYTKVVDWVGIIGRYTRQTKPTVDGTSIDYDGTGTAATIPGQYKIDPYSIPADIDPINDVDVTARGQTFYKELTWTEMSSMFGYTTGGTDFSSQIDRAAAIVPFTQRISMEQYLGSYNSGFGPNLTFTWRETAFDKNSSLPAGLVTFVLCCDNAFAAYRGTATVRYT